MDKTTQIYHLASTEPKYIKLVLKQAISITVKPDLSGHSKKTKIGFQDRLSFNAG